ncbi:ATP-dependent helicase rhp16 [Pandoravirus kuranda]|uniref:ATP-dependent helicase rhp16 n=1 Tax=Pandoravirus kuranda TaxID=3019033 RepID=A0AA95J453_9VIRU|nr:ATP-dependent helicase rhp16 [Pandoravirus kuranda]
MDQRTHDESDDHGGACNVQRLHGLTTTLLPHQVEAVEWMRSRERASCPGGGVLADDMGMGKTLDCIALVVSTPTTTTTETDGESPRRGMSPALPRKAHGSVDDICATSPATLVVAPLCLLDQWRLQIARHTESRARALIYHGAGRQAALARFLRKEPGHPLVTGQVVDAADDRAPPARVDDVQCAKDATDEQSTSRNSAQFVLTTYEIVQREHARRRHCYRHSHHGSRDTRGPLGGYHGQTDSEALSNVFDVLWFRVVLDEAHRIRTPGSAIHDAVLALRAPRRWCVTGTPYNNSCRDLQALARFVGVAPYRDGAWWETSPGGPEPSTDGRIERWTRQFVLMRDKRLVLKDTLPACTASSTRVCMDRAERVFYNDLVRSALRAYEAFAAAPPKDRAKPRMFGAVLAWVGRLRQACNHPLLAMGRGWRDGTAQNSRCGCCARPADDDPAGGGPGIMASCGHRLCALCAPGTADDVPSSSRAGSSCLACAAVARWNADADPARPRPSTKMRALVDYCARALASDSTARIVVFSQWTACLDLAEGFLRDAKIASVRYDGDVSGIARRASILATFSASSAHPLDNASQRRAASVDKDNDGRDVRMSSFIDRSHGSDGSSNNNDNNNDNNTRSRRMTLRSGTMVGAPESARVLLASLHCAGVGLDLSAANHVVLVDAWYNPFIEKQACDRVHRIGQTREVKVLRLLAASTVEADVARIQARKLREAAKLGLGPHDVIRPAATPPTTTTPNGREQSPSSSLGDAASDDARLALSETDIHEIFRRAMSRCRLRPVPVAPTGPRAASTVIVTTGKRKRE